MTALIELAPLVLFFLTFKLYGIYAATSVSILATGLHLLWHRKQTGRYDKTQVLTLIIITLLGSITLIFRNEAFIKWKPTLIYWLLAGGLIFTQNAQSPLLKQLTRDQIEVSASTWRKLHRIWALYFLGLGGLNLYVAHYFSTETWVHFKLFGTLGLTLVFTLVQGLYLIRLKQKGASV